MNKNRCGHPIFPAITADPCAGGITKLPEPPVYTLTVTNPTPDPQFNSAWADEDGAFVLDEDDTFIFIDNA